MGVMQIGRVPLVGRQTDLDALRDEVDAVRTEGRAVVVSGDAGMGKTRLIRDFTETLDGVIVLRGACLDSGSGPAPLTAVTDLLRDLVDALGVDAVREAAGPGADALSVLVPAISDRLGHAERLADVVVELISQLARTHRLVLIIEAHIYAGRLREAEQLGGLLPMVEPGLYSAFLRERLVCLAIWRGRIEGAEAAIGIARRELDMFGAYEFQTRFGLAYDLGELALAHGDARQALEHASLAWRTTTGGVLALPLTAVAARGIAMLRAAGEDADAGPFRAVLASMREWPVWPLWSALFAAELGEGPWTAVVDAGIGPAYFRAYARVRHGEALLAEGDRAGAREALAQAAAYADELGADGLVARARAVMSDAGLAGDAPRSVLTAREEQVLELVAEGLSNAQIAERLYISAKTVSVHVSAILRKLGAPSRAAAAAIHRSSAA